MTDNDGTSGFEEGEVNLQAFIDGYADIQRKALRAAAEVIVTRLEEATPLKADKAGGLPPGTLKENIRTRIQIGDGTAEKPNRVIVDFGQYSYVAHFVDGGHKPPLGGALAKAGHSASAGKPTPPHPFVRPVQDSTAAAAQEAYETTLTAEMTRVLSGGK